MFRIVRLLFGAVVFAGAGALVGGCAVSSDPIAVAPGPVEEVEERGEAASLPTASATQVEGASTPAPERTPEPVTPDPGPVLADADEAGRDDDTLGELVDDAATAVESRGLRAQAVEPTPTRDASRASATPTPTPTSTPTPTPTATPEPTTLFVAVDGTGNGMRRDQPMGSIGDAMQRLRPGMTLEIAAGRYVGDVLVQDPAAGTASEPIRVRTNGRVEVEGLVRFWRLVHWDIAGLNVTWPDWGTNTDHLVKLTGGSHWTFRDAEVWGAESYAGILVAGPAEFYTLTGLYVRDTVPSNEVNQDHLIYLNPRSGPGLVTRNLLVGSPNGRAIKVGGAVSEEVVSDVVISYNTMVDNQGPSNVQVSGRTYNIEIRNNIMVRSGEGRRAITAYDFRGDNVVAQDNVVWQVAGLGDAAIRDLGGNLRLDPEFDDGYRAMNAEAQHAGHLAE